MWDGACSGLSSPPHPQPPPCHPGESVIGEEMGTVNVVSMQLVAWILPSWYERRKDHHLPSSEELVYAVDVSKMLPKIA